MNKLGRLIGAVLLAGAGVLFWQGMQPSSDAATQSDRQSAAPDTMATTEGAPLVQITLPETLSADAQIGQRAFNSACAACHGVNAGGRNGVAPPLVHKIYEPGHHADEAFQRAVKYGVQAHHWNFGNMSAIEGLTRAEVQYIVSYVRELQRTNGIN